MFQLPSNYGAFVYYSCLEGASTCSSNCLEVIKSSTLDRLSERDSSVSVRESDPGEKFPNLLHSGCVKAASKAEAVCSGCKEDIEKLQAYLKAVPKVMNRLEKVGWIKSLPVSEVDEGKGSLLGRINHLSVFILTIALLITVASTWIDE